VRTARFCNKLHQVTLIIKKLESQIIASNGKGLFCRIFPNITEKINVHAEQMNGILQNVREFATQSRQYD
jgi:hypothetical protein